MSRIPGKPIVETSRRLAVPSLMASAALLAGCFFVEEEATPPRYRPNDIKVQSCSDAAGPGRAEADRLVSEANDLIGEDWDLMLDRTEWEVIRTVNTRPAL